MPNLSGLKLPHFSFRFFVYLLFALVLLALLAEGGYYTWLRNRDIGGIRIREISPQEATSRLKAIEKDSSLADKGGVFSFMTRDNNEVKGTITGTVEKIDEPYIYLVKDNEKVKVRLREGTTLTDQDSSYFHQPIKEELTDLISIGNDLFIGELQIIDKEITGGHILKRSPYK